MRVFNRQILQIVYTLIFRNLILFQDQSRSVIMLLSGRSFLLPMMTLMPVDADQMQLDDLRVKDFNQLAALSLSLALKVQSQ